MADSPPNDDREIIRAIFVPSRMSASAIWGSPWLISINEVKMGAYVPGKYRQISALAIENITMYTPITVMLWIDLSIIPVCALSEIESELYTDSLAAEIWLAQQLVL